ncbi:MAG: hypothetical protein OEM52_07920 [bacterium]|nr:hypothetical protein [bacterium]
MTWLDEYVERLFDDEELPDLDEFAEEQGIAASELKNIDSGLLHDAVMRKFKREVATALPKLGGALLEKGLRGDIPAIRLLMSLAKPETAKGKVDDPMETYRDL